MKNLSHKRKRPQEETHKEDNNEMKQNLEELKQMVEIFQKEIENVKKKDEEKDELIDIILQKNKMFEESIIKLKEKNRILEEEFSKIYPVALSCQLRKLLKKLFEFIVNDKYLSSGLSKIGAQVYFIIPKEFYSGNFSKYDTIRVFTLLLQIIQSYPLDCDYKINYVDKNAFFHAHLRKRINIFNNYSEFFRFFNIDKKYEEILIKYIPHYLFYSIDNYTFEEKMSSLISKIK